MLCQALQSAPVSVQCRIKVDVVFLQLCIVYLCVVLLSFALFKLTLRLLHFLSDVSQEKILVQLVNVGKLNVFRRLVMRCKRVVNG
jgi:hypothetical protein